MRRRVSARELRPALLEEAALRIGVDELERAVVGVPRLVLASQPAKELGARRVQVVVAIEVETIGQDERGLGVPGLGQRGGAIELDDLRAGDLRELAVERGDPSPVDRVLDVQRCDRGLESVRPPSSERDCAVERATARFDAAGAGGGR